MIWDRLPNIPSIKSDLKKNFSTLLNKLKISVQSLSVMAIVLPRRSDISLTDTPSNENYFVHLNSFVKKSTLCEVDGHNGKSRIFPLISNQTTALHCYVNVIPVWRYVTKKVQMQFEFPALGIHGLHLYVYNEDAISLALDYNKLSQTGFPPVIWQVGYYYYNILGEKKPTERMVFDVRQNLFKFDSGLWWMLVVIYLLRNLCVYFNLMYW